MDPRERYARQTMLPEIGPEGQRRFAEWKAQQEQDKVKQD